MAITLRTVTGSALSYTQVDENFSSYFYSSSISASVITLFRTGSATIGVLPSSSSITLPMPSKWTDITSGIQRSSLVKVVGPFAQGTSNVSATGLASHAQGDSTTASGTGSHAEGYSSVASGLYSHAEGQQTQATEIGSHAEGYLAQATGQYSHVEGRETTATNTGSHAEGYTTQAIGRYSHAEGYLTEASGQYSHTEGRSTLASGTGSHAEGLGTIASGDYQHTQGKYNIASSEESAFIIGNGISDGSRSNLIHAAGTTVQVTGSLNVNGAINTVGNLTVQGNITAEQYIVSTSIYYVTQSYNSGSHIFGNSLDDTHQFTGSVLITGSLSVSGSIFGTASFALDAFNVVHRTGDETITGTKSFGGTAASNKIVVTTGNANGVFAATDVGNTGYNFYSQNRGTGIGIYADTTVGDSIVSSGAGTGRVFVGQNGVTTTSTIDRFGNITATSFTGSLLGTASRAVSASWAPNAGPIEVYNNFSEFGTLYSTAPPAASATTNVTMSIVFGWNAGGQSSNLDAVNFLGNRAGRYTNSIVGSNFIGYQTGQETSASRSNFLGQYTGLRATNASDSNFFGYNTGTSASAANDSNFLGYQAGFRAINASNSNFIGRLAGQDAASASFSTLIGHQVGFEATATASNSIGSNNIIIGTNITLAAQQRNAINLGGIIFATGSYATTTGNPFSGSMPSSRVGIATTTPQYTLDVNGSGNFTSNLTVTGSSTIVADAPTLLVTRGNGDTSIRLTTGDTSFGTSGSLYYFGSQFFKIDSLTRLKLSTSDKERITIENNGSILINSGGLASADAVFQVNEQSEFTGSLRGSVSALTIASTTASIDFSTANFFTVQLVSGSNTHISASNIRPGQTTSIRVTQPNPAGGTVTFSSAFKQPDGYPYIPTTTALGVDVLTVVSFDSTNALMVSVNKLA